MKMLALFTYLRKSLIKSVIKLRIIERQRNNTFQRGIRIGLDAVRVQVQGNAFEHEPPALTKPLPVFQVIGFMHPGQSEFVPVPIFDQGHSVRYPHSLTEMP